MAEHVLKCWKNYFDAVERGVKRFEWRKDDRGFEVGDVLVLRKYDPSPNGSYGDRGYVMQSGGGGGAQSNVRMHVDLRVRVTYILRGAPDMPPGFCVMSIEPIGSEEP